MHLRHTTVYAATLVVPLTALGLAVADRLDLGIAIAIAIVATFCGSLVNVLAGVYDERTTLAALATHVDGIDRPI